MALFLDTISKINKNGVVYNSIDETLFRNIFDLKLETGKVQIRSKKHAFSGVCEYPASGKITVEKLVNAYKAYSCKIISEEQISKIKKEYYESNIKNC